VDNIAHSVGYSNSFQRENITLYFCYFSPQKVHVSYVCD